MSRLYYACYSLFNLHFVKPGAVSRELGSLYNDLFENRQKGDYMDFVSFDGDQVRPWIAQTEVFVAEIAALVAADAPSAEAPGRDDPAPSPK